MPERAACPGAAGGGPAGRGTIAIIAAVALLVGLVNAALWSAITVQLGHDRRQTGYVAETAATNLARAFEEHVARTVQGVDSVLYYVRSKLREHRIPELLNTDQAAVARQLPHLLGGHFLGPMTPQLGIINAKGELVLTNRGEPAAAIDLSDREHVRIHRDSDSDQLFISKPAVGRLSGKPAIRFTRPLSAPGQPFSGIIGLSLEPSYFSDFYDSIDVGRNGAIVLIGTDRVIRARAPKQGVDASPMIGRTVPDRNFFHPGGPDAGIYRIPSSVDGIARLGAFRRLKDYPLVVLVLLAETEVFAAYEQRKTTILWVGAGVSLLVLLGGAAIGWLFDRTRRQHDRLVDQTLELRQLAETDGLTQLPNRRSFHDRARAEHARAQRHHRSLAMLIADIDHFKRINDGFGHGAGDQVLAQLARRLAVNLRAHDLIGRLGGEEFGILLPETAQTAAGEVAEKLRRAIADQAFVTGEGTAIPVTLSIGLAVPCREDADLQDMMRRADHALYAAKRQGRNRVIHAPADPLPEGAMPPPSGA